ncbi:MAG: hypothetical protein UY20_C0002G0037 [Candidatus Yanofskybacteria bacterium GW2011_GWA1_48_10]|uniref:Uncharacterized protein n=3 Tax=Parcubacteria group TaxID=1794811 RepID=A0A0G1U7F4_9BACT|nr:MAG: hypothetical protein UY01_C0009G0011 [Candidatus Nomurabacteria bacterium GW2011_GWB1_47_6]KKU90057.1 MAG: hypothetical protein UY20_C0002G0037 [Candidatus Yanofskybacteria bacterium GW2011_GWA1_48_10]OGN05967.1 MAG: hypothetical protein A2669_01200 [Candidatus Yanofskybacteria bacterium RIFCSPHIGHO2_01_FULL_48_25b]
MASLISDMSGGDMVATFEVLSRNKITTEHLWLLRKFPMEFAAQALRGIFEAHQTYLEATTTEPDAWAIAVAAVERIDDVDMLQHIYQISLLPEVWLAVIQRIKKEHVLFQLILFWTGAKRRLARLAGLRRLDENTHLALVRHRKSDERQKEILEIVNEVRRERGLPPY